MQITIDSTTDVPDQSACGSVWFAQLVSRRCDLFFVARRHGMRLKDFLALPPETQTKLEAEVAHE